MNMRSTINLRGGSEMPAVGLGTWQLTGEDALISVSDALKLGYRLIDTSSDYNNHEQVGQAINNSRVPRDEIFLTTKVEEDDSYEAVKQYIKQLDQDSVDLILIHRPPHQGVGVDLWRGLIQAKIDGFTNEVGVSNYSVDELEELIKSTGVIPAVNQIEWTPFGHSKKMLRFCRQNNIVIQAYSPLTHGERIDDETVVEIAEKYSKTPAQILIRWNIECKVVPIVKATSRPHLEENLSVFDFEITKNDMQKLNNLNEKFSALGSRLQYA